MAAFPLLLLLCCSRCCCCYCGRRIDLLKIDVERAELQVLQGVAAHHWPAIRQVAMEVRADARDGGAATHLLGIWGCKKGGVGMQHANALARATFVGVED